MEFRLLGPLEVRDDRGVVIPLPRRQQRALLAALLVRPGSVVSIDRLVDLLWGERPPRSAVGSLQNTVSRLRRLLGADVLRTRPPGYVLDVPAEAVDAARFEWLLTEAASLDAAGRAEALREALALWRGPALADLADEPWARAEADRLDELRLAAVEERIEAELELGRHAVLVAQLEALAAEHPLRERLRRQLALALYRSGRQADALAACRSTSAALDELGLEPSPELRELERDILRQSPHLSAPATTAEEEPEPVVGERRVVSVLAAGLAGDDDPEALRARLTRVLEAANAAVQRHGGAIERFGPEGLVAVFGADESHEDDALRAVRAAVELREQAGVAVAVATGEAIVADEPRVTGTVVARAASLARSRVGILVDPRTHELVRDAVTTDAAGVVAVQAGRPERRDDVPLVGRQAELARLREALAAAVSERRCVSLVVVGEAGIGKSRLARELQVLVDAGVLDGRCASYGEGATFMPLVEALRGIDVAAVLGDEGAAAATRIEELGRAAPEPASLGETYWAVRRLLEGLARVRPPLLLLDDVHWAEPALLDLVEYLAARVTDAPLLVLCLARPELLDERPGWAEGALRLEPLADDQARTLVVATAELDDEAATRVVELADGNPLYAQQLATFAAESGKALEPGAMPATLDAVLAGRFGRLDAGERATLQRAAVVGREFSRGAVAALAPPDLAVDAYLLALARSGFIHAAGDAAPGDDAYRFHHVLLRDAAYATLLKEQRAELHERLAEWLDRDGAGDDVLVGYHLEQATHQARDVGRPADELALAAGARLGRAGIGARIRADERAALGLLTRAADLIPSSALRAELSYELAIALQSAGRYLEARGLAAQALSDARRNRATHIAARAAVEDVYAGFGHRPGDTPDRLLEVAEEARPVLEAAEDDRGLGRLWVHVCYAENFRLRYAETERAARQALVHYRRARFPTDAATSWLASAYYFGPTPVPEAIRRCRAEIAATASRSGEAQLLTVLSGLLAFAGKFRQARELSAEALAKLTDLGMESYVSLMWTEVAIESARLAGDLDGAMELGRVSLQRIESGGLRADGPTRMLRLAEVELERDSADDARELLEAAQGSVPEYDPVALALTRSVEARLLARARGRHTRARELAAEAVALVSDTDALPDRAKLELALAEIELLTGRPARARAAAERAERLYEAKGHLAGARRAAELTAPPVGA